MVGINSWAWTKRHRRGQRAKLGALAADQRGATAIEFAFVAAPFIALLLASIETSLVFFTQESLETAVETAARSVITGQTQAADATGTAAGMTQAQEQERFRQAACASLPRYMSCSNLYADVESGTTWGDVNTSVPTMQFDSNGKPTNSFKYQIGGAGSVVMVRLFYFWPVQIGPLGFNLSNISNNKRLMIATSVAKVENSS